MKRLWLAAAFSLLGGAALAHSSGDQAKSVAECQKFPGTASFGARGECLKCVQRQKPHHFHGADKSCHPDDAK